MREKKEQTLTLPLPARKESGDLLEEESFGVEPAISAESALELSKLGGELAQLRPQMELAAENSRKAAAELREEFRREQKEFLHQSEKQREQIRKDMENLRLRFRQMRGDWL
jgi:hypothetical protein